MSCVWSGGGVLTSSCRPQLQQGAQGAGLIWCVPDRFGQDAYDAVEQGPQQTGVDVWRGHVARSAAQARPQRQLCPALGGLQPQSCQPLRMPFLQTLKNCG